MSVVAASEEQLLFEKDKMLFLYKSEDPSDCVFIVGDDKIPAHKLVLSVNSPVFEMMFYGPMASSQIEIVDIDIEHFKQMLEFVYTENISIQSVANAWSLIYISQKYLISNLTDICTNFISTNLCQSNLLLCYEYAELYNLKSFAKRCWQDIQVHTKVALLSDYHMKASTLRSIVAENELSLNEEDLIESAATWAAEECTERNMEVTNENKLAVLIEDDIYQHLRFRLINFDKHDVLKDLCPIKYLYNDYSTRQSVPCDISNVNMRTDARKPKNYSLLFKFRDTYKIARSFPIYSSCKFACTVVVNRKVVMYGVSVTGTTFLESLEIGIYKGDTEICKTKVTPTCLDRDSLQSVKFSEIVFLDVNTEYTITVKYFSQSDVTDNEILSHYLSDHLPNRRRNSIFTFYDGFDGAVVRGIAFYPI